MSGKGDTPRPVDKARWDANYTRIFPDAPSVSLAPHRDTAILQHGDTSQEAQQARREISGEICG